MLKIDGVLGEGGGQVLRTSLALSAVTGKAFCIERIRGNKAHPSSQGYTEASTRGPLVRWVGEVAKHLSEGGPTS